jgi:hypothetical protein
MIKKLAVFAVLAPIAAYASEAIRMLNTADLCHFNVNNVQISSAKIYGTAGSIESFLGRQGFVFIKSCSWALNEALAPGSIGSSQEAYVVETHSKPSSLAKYQDLGPFDIVVRIDDPRVFLRAFEAKPAPVIATAGAGGKDTPPPNGSQVLTDEPAQSEEEICEVKGDFCLFSNGEASFTVQCGALKVSISSEGTFNVGLGVQKEISEAGSQ